MLKERDNLPSLRVGQMSERGHATKQRAVSQNPIEDAGLSARDLCAIERERVSTPLAGCAMTCGALASIQFGASALGLLVCVERVFDGGIFRRRLLKKVRTPAQRGAKEEYCE